MPGRELGCEHTSLEPLQPLLPIFSSSAISRALELFQFPGEEEVSGRAQPDGIYSTEAGNPPHTPCTHPVLQSALAVW